MSFTWDRKNSGLLLSSCESFSWPWPRIMFKKKSIDRRMLQVKMNKRDMGDRLFWHAGPWPLMQNTHNSSHNILATYRVLQSLLPSLSLIKHRALSLTSRQVVSWQNVLIFFFFCVVVSHPWMRDKSTMSNSRSIATFNLSMVAFLIISTLSLERPNSVRR